MHYAASYGHKEIIELLIAKGADVNAKNNFEDTPLDVVSIEAADLHLIHGGMSGWDFQYTGRISFPGIVFRINGRRYEDFETDAENG